MPVCLHTHSWYSLLEGASSPEALLRRARAGGYTALALTDSSNLYGATAFAQLAKAHDIRPIFGACLRQKRTRCVALIAEPAGYRSLCRILSRLHQASGGRQPPVEPASHGGLTPPARLDELLGANAAGLHLLVDDAALAESLRDAFGARLWLEIVRPRGGDPRHEPELLAAARRLDLPVVASCAAHFAELADYAAFRRITAVRQGILLEQLPRRLSIAPEHHLVDVETLRQRFHDLPDAVANTDRLAEQLQSDVLPSATILPPAFVPRQLDEVRFLRALCERGLERRDVNDAGYRARLDNELAVIVHRNLAGYFLVVRDIARYARRRGHPMALRGSAGNSLVCYLLEITDVDPLRFGLPMERFLHRDRQDLPDIDLDFDWKVRDDVIAHVFERYGPEHTAMISSHLFLQPRSAFREAAKLHGLSNEQWSVVSGQWSDRTELLTTDHWPLPTRFPLEPERWPRLVADARMLLGRPHHLSIHPGGVVITPGPIADHIPLQPAPKGVVITQLDKDGVEAIGLVKIDLLGNRGLATLEEALKLKAQMFSRDPKGSAADVQQQFSPRSPVGSRLNDAKVLPPEVLALLQQGDTLGVNQLESPAMKHLLIQMQPRGVDDVIQSLALIRPGAASIGAKELFVRRRRGLEPVRYPHPCLEPVLGDTQGLMLYEDDSLHVIAALTGLALPEADVFRKRIAKHSTLAEAAVLTREFAVLCTAHGIPYPVVEEVWEQLAKFNRYSFCKSHAVSYGLIACRAATLKAHAPLAFWTAALNNNQGMYPRRVYIEAIKRAGIRVLLPCVNRSAGPFAIEEDAIRTGLEAIGAFDEALRTAILTERARHGVYHDLADLRRRVGPGPEALALLIRCGALDFTGQPRPELFLEADLASGGRKPPVESLSGSTGGLRPPLARELFPRSEVDWTPPDYSARRRQVEEWDILGFLAGPPLLTLFGELPRDRVVSKDLAQHIGRRVRVAGLVATGRSAEMEDGRSMQFITLEDETGLTDVTIFPGTCPLTPHLRLGPYVATGLIEEQYGIVTLTAERFEELETS